MFTRTVRPTGEKLTVATAEEFGADAADGKWITFCEDHKTIVNSATQKLAYETHGSDFCDGCRARILANPTVSKVNFSVRTQAVAYSEGMKDGMDLLVTALEEGGDINYLLEVLEANARPETRDRLNSFYSTRNATKGY